MKKFLFLTLIFSAIISTTIHAQASSDVAAMPVKAKETLKPQMIEKTGLTEAQADKVIEINFAFRQRLANALRGLNEADRAAKIAEFKTAKEKMLNEFLTPDQIKSVNAFYEDLGKNMPQKSGS